ncbi:MAG: sigma-54-dependent transcriptional regulator [Candidatus Zhuqueibacterota bacterium]
MLFRLLIVDDEEVVRKSLARVLACEEYSIELAESGPAALDKVNEERPDLVLLDIKMEGLDGVEVLKKIKEKDPEIVVVMVTGFASVPTAIESMKAGAYDYIQKPVKPHELRKVVTNALESLQLKKEVEELRRRQMENNKFDKIIGNSQELQHVLSLVQRFAPSKATMLIEGESGTGKELIAEYTHYLSPRYARPFIALNCGAVHKDLLESELFGYVKGAFTGAADHGKPGLLEQANHGTIFLDEVGEMPMDAQVKFLRVLENGEFYHLGSPELIKVNLRVIAATNVPLIQLVERGKFRKDLYYRLNIAKIELPALRDRRMDIIPLAKFFIDHFNKAFGKRIKGMSNEVEEILLAYPWHGNVRELRNIIERVMLLDQKDIISVEDLASAGVTHVDSYFNIIVKLNTNSNGNVLHKTMRDIVEKALSLSKGNKTLAAKRLGVPRSTLRHYLHRVN